MLYVALGLSAASCGGQPTEPATHQRLVVRLLPDAAAVADDRVVARFDLLADRPAWTVEAPAHAVALQPGPGPEAERRALQLRAERTPELTRLILRAPVDFGDFDELHFEVLWSGHGGAHIEAWRGERVVAASPNLIVAPSERLQRVALPVTAALRAAGACDGLSLRFDGDKRSIQVRHVQLVRRAAAALLPRPESGAELDALGTERRRAVGVAAGRAVAVEFSADGARELRFALGRTETLLRSGNDDVLVVAVRDEGGRKVEQRILLTDDLRRGPRWLGRRVPLDGLRGRVSAQFTFEAGRAGADGAVALAELVLVAEGSARPNVLLITSDTHRGDGVGFLVQDPAHLLSPAIDALAARGEAWLDGFSTSNVTNPAHMALLTGEHPRDIGVLDNATGLGAGARTLAEAFAEQGYVTWAVVSTAHLGPEGSGLGQGFDRMDAPPHKPRDAAAGVAIARQWLAELDGRPLFLWMHVFDAHWPYAPPPAWDRRFYPRGADPRDPELPPLPLPDGVLPPDMAGLRDLEYPRAQYRAEIGALDEALGTLLAEPQLRAAITAFTADHGESLGEHGIWFNHDGLYLESLHVPLILAWPGAQPGARHTTPVTTQDLGRTLLDLAELPTVPFPGRSLVRTAAGRAAPPRFALASGGVSASVTWDGWHLVLHLRGYRSPRMEQAAERHAVELYAYDRDPGCTENLLDAEPARAAELRARLIDWLRSARDLGWAGERATDEATLQQLEALGYVGGEEDGPRTEGPLLWEPDACNWCRRFD